LLTGEGTGLTGASARAAEPAGNLALYAEIGILSRARALNRSCGRRLGGCLTERATEAPAGGASDGMAAAGIDGALTIVR
jgi:hypothetical protein